jgi:hypothetical protein
MSQDIEVAAREMGWRPKEEFRGDAEKWVDASTWVSRGENFIPILRADRDAAKRRADELETKLGETTKLLEASQEAIQGLKEFQTELTRDKVKQAKREVLTRLREAREAGETNVELRLMEELDELREAEREAKTPTPAPKPPAAPAAAPTAPALDPDLKAWIGDNPWFESSHRKRGLAMGIADEIRADPKTKGLKGKAFFEELDRQLALEPSFGGERRESKVDGGRPSGGSGAGSGGKSFADLPPEAKAACEKQSRYLVGPGRAYKDAKDWQAAYAKTYFDMEA